MTQNRSVLDWPTGTTVFKPEKCYNGYTVVTPYRSHLTFLVDMAGRVVHSWKGDPVRDSQAWYFERQENGNWMSMVHRIPAGGSCLEPSPEREGDFEHTVVEFDWKGNVVWRYTAPPGWVLHHDFARLQNGNTIIASQVTLEVANVSRKPIKENFFIEVNKQGEVVWDWYTAQHFDEFGYPDETRQLMDESGGDIFHTNTVSPLPGNALESADSRFRKGNLLSCQRSTNVIYIVDKASTEVVWTWGAKKGQLVGPHHPIMLHNGNILIYDNGGRAGYPEQVRFHTRLVEIEPLSGNIVWQYEHEPYIFKGTSKFFSSSWGSVQRLPNGNTFSLDCHKGRLFEVTPSGEIVWEYISPFAWGRGTQVMDSGIYRAYRYGYEEVAEPDSVFMNTDGHLDVQPLGAPIPKNLGLPSQDRP